MLRSAYHRVLVRAAGGGTKAGAAANDNPPPGWTPELTAALRHFAGAGLAASATARLGASAADAAGDRAAADHWLAIGGLFGPPLSDRTAQQAAHTGSPALAERR